MKHRRSLKGVKARNNYKSMQERKTEAQGSHMCLSLALDDKITTTRFLDNWGGDRGELIASRPPPLHVDTANVEISVW